MRSSSKEKRLFKQEVRTTQERLEGNFRTDNGGGGGILKFRMGRIIIFCLFSFTER